MHETTKDQLRDWLASDGAFGFRPDVMKRRLDSLLSVPLGTGLQILLRRARNSLFEARARATYEWVSYALQDYTTLRSAIVDATGPIDARGKAFKHYTAMHRSLDPEVDDRQDAATGGVTAPTSWSCARANRCSANAGHS